MKKSKILEMVTMADTTIRDYVGSDSESISRMKFALYEKLEASEQIEEEIDIAHLVDQIAESW
jgi:hypothetical protein